MKEITPLRAGTLAFFFGQLRLMVHAGIPLLQGVRLLSAELGRQPQRQRLQQGLYLMEQGCPFSSVMMQSQVFPLLACQIMKAGESSGMMETMLALLSDYYATAHAQRQRLIQALGYPIFLVVCTIFFCLGAVFGIVPLFADMFAQLQIPLPRATQILLDIVHTVRRHFLAISTGLCLGSAIILYGWRCQTWRQGAIRYVLRNHQIQTLCLSLCWQRFSQILAIQLSSGVPLLQALAEAAAAVPCVWFRQDIEKVRQDVAQGTTLSQAVRQHHLSTAYIETMLRIGETTGKYEEVLGAIHGYYQWHTEQWLTLLQKALGPAVLCIVGVSIGAMIICLVMPLLDVASGMTMSGGL